jgi:hypothetical protein
MTAHGYVTTTLQSDKKCVTIGSFEGGHDCCYQYASLDKDEVQELIENLMALHEEMEEV